MKVTLDNRLVPDRCWYYLLDWNEADKWNTIQTLYKENRLMDLTHAQFWNLFSVATKSEIKSSNLQPLNTHNP